MSKPKRLRAFFTGAFVFIGIAIHAGLAQTYTLTDLGTLGGEISQPFALNNVGQVVGRAEAKPRKSETVKDCDNFCNIFTFYYYEEHAFLWTPKTPNGSTGHMADLGMLMRGDNYSIARSINVSGQVVGASGSGDYYYGSFRTASFTYSGGQLDDLGALGFPTNATVLSINAAGQILAYAYDPSGSGWILWQNGTLTSLGFAASGLNDLGQVVGSSGNRAVLWQNGIETDLGTLPGDTVSGAYGINTNGQVVGVSGNWNTPEGIWHGFLFTIDSLGTVTERTDLGALPGDAYASPHGINNLGQAVGVSYPTTNGGQYRAFLWDKPHGTRDLQSFLPAGSGWVWEVDGAPTLAINDAGQIVAPAVNPTPTCQSHGDCPTHALLLTPLPAPRLSSPSIQVAGQFSFTLAGEAGRSYTIQASTNLLNWADLTNFVSATSTNQFTDPTAPNFTRRFYRAVTQ